VTIRTNTILYTSALILVVAIIIAFGVIKSIKTELIENYKKDSFILHNFISNSLVSPLYNIDIGKIQLISENAQAQSRINSIIILDEDGYILTDGTEKNDLQDEELTSSLSQLVYKTKKRQLELTETELKVGGPVYLNNKTELKGYLFIAFDIENLKTTIEHSTSEIINLSIFCWLLGIFLSLILSQQIISPIKRIIKVAEKFSSGQLDILVQHEKGELGVLTQTLETMANNLQRSMMSKDSLKSILDNIPEMIFVLDLDFRITQVNCIAQEKLSKGNKQLLGLNIQQIIPNLDIKGKSLSNYETHISYNLEEIPIIFSSTKIDKTGYVCAAIDIALQKETEKELKRAIDDANLANRAKSSFLANMSHEIRTPLNAMIGYTELLLEEEITQEQRNMIELVKLSSDSLLVLINDILDLSKIEAGELILETVPVNLTDCLYEVCEIQRTKIHNKPLELNIDTSKLTHAHVYSDQTRLKQILLNLVNNAIKFTTEGEIIISAETLETNDRQNIKFSVSDTGIGMSDNQLNYIFDAFKQADSSTTREFGGTGLGLNISKNIIQLMGSNISVSSEVGKGTIFSFTLQLKKYDEPEKTLGAYKKLNGKHIIVLEKSAIAINTLKSQLTKVNVETTICLDLIELYSKVTEKSFDFILVNIISLQDQLSLIAKLKELQFRGHVIALTANISNNTINSIKRSGFDAYLLKPVRAENLYQKMLTFQEDSSSETSSSINPEAKTTEVIKAHILIVDDNKANQFLLKKILSKMGHTSDLADNGKEAVTMAENKTYDLIMMDMQMPILDGPQATIAIRKTGNKTPIIALTANAFESDKATCLNAGMNDYLTKPINRNKLCLVIQNYCQIKPSSQKRLLIVEDDKTSATIMHTYLKKMPSLTLRTAYNGIEACTLLGSFMPHIIILDIILPDLDGFGVLDFLKTNEKYKSMKIIIYSSASDIEERLKSYDIAAIIKKTDKEQLLHSVSQLIR
jgi:signal transduction histidine kinase/DNA-binding response OmpR family regulator